MSGGTKARKLEFIEERWSEQVIPAHVRGFHRDVLFSGTSTVCTARGWVAVLAPVLRVETRGICEASRQNVLVGKIMIDLNGPRVLVLGNGINRGKVLIRPRIAGKIWQRRDALHHFGHRV